MVKYACTNSTDSTEPFNCGYKINLPACSNYLLGYQVHPEVGKKHSLREPTHLGGD
jgi:hypothetical protein